MKDPQSFWKFFLLTPLLCTAACAEPDTSIGAFCEFVETSSTATTKAAITSTTAKEICNEEAASIYESPTERRHVEVQTLDYGRAINACRLVLQEQGEDTRTRYQLARALVAKSRVENPDLMSSLADWEIAGSLEDSPLGEALAIFSELSEEGHGNSMAWISAVTRDRSLLDQAYSVGSLRALQGVFIACVSQGRPIVPRCSQLISEVLERSEPNSMFQLAKHNALVALDAEEDQLAEITSETIEILERSAGYGEKNSIAALLSIYDPYSIPGVSFGGVEKSNAQRFWFWMKDGYSSDNLFAIHLALQILSAHDESYERCENVLRRRQSDLFEALKPIPR